ncbi:hypothetical protein F4810DRAFT_677779 [Camillea tinctor]|nr:hypothetical protein F4810DRAFT_677779 [Camillea tinctor]
MGMSATFSRRLLLLFLLFRLSVGVLDFLVVVVRRDNRDARGMVVAVLEDFPVHFNRLKHLYYIPIVRGDFGMGNTLMIYDLRRVKKELAGGT